MAEEDLGFDGEFQQRRAAAGFGSHVRMNTGTIKQSLPVLKVNVPLAISTHDVFDLFQQVSGKNKF